MPLKTILALLLSAFLGLNASSALAQQTDPIKDALAGCGVITFNSNAQGFRTASTRENRTVNSGPFDAPHTVGSLFFRWEATGGNPDGHVRADDFDGEYQEVWTPAFTDSDFSALNGQQLQFDYRNDTGYNQYRLYVAIVGTNGNQYYYYFNSQLGSPGSWSRVKVPMVASAWHTGFEASENPSTPPDSFAPDSIDFANVLNSLSRIAISVEGISGPDTSRFDNFGRACDGGDLPETGTSFVTTGANAARHNISDAIYLGALIDTEPSGQPTTAANGDDANFSDDEDGIATLPLLPIATANYSLPVAVTNRTGNAATLYGWIDWDGNSRFELAEIQTATVPGDGSIPSVTLTWPNVRVSPGTTRYARLRFTTFSLADTASTPADERAQGIASDGEVEDYLLSAAPLGSLTVIKNAVGGNDSFSFNTTGLFPTSFILTTAGGTAQRTFANLLPGFYSVTELLSPAWDLTSATCSDGSNPASINLVLSENVTCTFTNTKRGSLTVVKDALYGNGTFNFTSQALGAFSLTTAGGTAQRTFDLLAAGTYDVSETVPNGWRQDSATCSDGSNPASVNLATGEDVTCTFRNAKQDSIVVVKRAAGGDATFNFVSQSLGNFSLTTVNGLAQRSFDNLADGVYDLSETVPAGWTLSSAACSDGSPINRIALNAGETVTCTFDNAKQDTLIVEKRTRGGDGAFSFTSPQLGPFTLTTSGGTTTAGGVASRAFTGLAAGAYNIAETVPAGWTQTAATCDNGNPPSNVQLAPGQTVKCTFENEKQDTIIVVKRAVGGDGTFPFASQSLGNFNLKTVKGEAQRSFTNLRPGIYDLSETVPVGWTLSGTPTCSDGSSVNQIDLSPGKTVVCVFVNLRQDTLIVEKRTQGGDGAFPFTVTGNATPIAPFILTTANGVASQSLAGLAAGTYNIAEAVPAEWRQTGATCDNGNPPNSVQLAPGQTVRCTFENEKQGTIIVVKRALGEDRAFSFVSASLGNFDLTTVNGEVQRTFSNRSPGTYDVSETVPPGWELSGGDPTCSDGSPASSIDLSAGETVLCVFINLQDDTIVVESRTVGGDGTFAFTWGDSHPPFSLMTTGGVATTARVVDPTKGPYAVSETVPTGWRLTSATCDNGDPPDLIDLEPGETVKCTFVNQRLNQNSATGIPTLSEWGLIIFSILLALSMWQRGPMRLSGRR